MSWAVGNSETGRDIGYGVPAECDHPRCKEQIDRGMSYVCGGHPDEQNQGCGLFFCAKHLAYRDTEKDSPQLCPRCRAYRKDPFPEKPDRSEWLLHKLTDPTWQEWRDRSPDEVKAIVAEIHKRLGIEYGWSDEYGVA